MNLISIKKIAAEKGITLVSIAGKLEMSTANLHKCVKANRIEAGDLEKIAQILNVPISYFFDEYNITIEQMSVSKNKKYCQGCFDKQKIIRLLEDKVFLLEEKNDNLQDDLAEAKKENACLQQLVASGAANPADAA